ncbi:MAG: winged helix-turn-helix transcriptional regulator [Clostridia bacterium]|nr:winged helix-turn-helix transcriptional regulator [Clostridia bacterium]
MADYEKQFNDVLLDIFDGILITEEKALRTGSFSDLTIAEMHTLESIGLYDARTMSETAATLGVTTGTLTVAVDRLVRKGYVRRERDLYDRRIVRVMLTKKGKLAYRIHSKFHRLLVERITNGLDEDRRTLLLGMLENIAGFIHEQVRRYDYERLSVRGQLGKES